MNQDRTNLSTALEDYLKSGRQFGDGEKFYLLGFDYRSSIPAWQSKSPLRKDFSKDGNTTSACAMNPTRRDSLPEQ